MAASLVSVVMQFLTPDLIAKIASGLGLDRSVAQKAIGGAVPDLRVTRARSRHARPCAGHPRLGGDKRT